LKKEHNDDKIETISYKQMLDQKYRKSV